ncbi:response regulator transcription factor [Microscilla marina]|uniref:Transcriptional regulatory protein RprY n=1 Tax=Microscilla marina ATCC 23134 TaxID=313606 RepID=A1ZV03_MICM2|nr:response regulator transcription factor [Microscilla marina]EAY25781.1 transcriptional regulatory protein RprY [Microscilla marina ATCC 23134]
MKAHILFVEDDASLALVTKDSLELRDYRVTHCANGQLALEQFQQDNFDLCLFDVMLPQMDGFTLAEKVRTLNHEIPIIFLTAKAMQEDKIAGLKLGADDYITKPFSIEEVVLKIEVFLKRSRFAQSDTRQTKFTIGLYAFDFQDLKLQYQDGQPRRLTQREAELLRFFCLHQDKILKREDILKNIWGDDDYFFGRSLDVFITRLRKYLKADPAIKIENIHGVGFKMIVKN